MAEEQGISKKEIGVVQSIVMAVSGGRVRAQFRVARARQRQEVRKARAKSRDET